MSTTTADKARIDAQIALIPRLRGTGPNPFDYDQWDARTAEILTAAFGADSDEVARYQRVVGEPGRVAGVRGNAGNMTLNIHGQWGILERLERAESLLRSWRRGRNFSAGCGELEGRLYPQHTAVPSCLRAQVRSQPLLIATKLSSAGGDIWSGSPKMPSNPQHCAVPSGRRAQVCSHPVLRDMKRSPTGGDA